QVRKPSDRKRFWGAAGPALILAKRSQPERVWAPAFEACKALTRKRCPRRSSPSSFFGQTKPAARGDRPLSFWPNEASRKKLLRPGRLAVRGLAGASRGAT